MCAKWTGSESGILRKSEFKEKKEELFVFGYSCKLFRDDSRALQIDQGKHLIPWMGDETLKIDRYDGRGALHDLSVHEAPPGGFDWRVELNRNELEMEQLCDEERYRALHTDENEEEMYKEEELKRLHAAGYGQVGFNYDTPAEPAQPTPSVEDDEPFVPTEGFKALLPGDMILPETDKQNAIIEKTAKFIASQGAQMEILIKTKQGDNPQFKFLNRDSPLHPYYTALTGLVKAGKWPEKIPEVVEEKPPENEEYLHPSLASTIIELAPSIPSLPYKPSADCDYTLLMASLARGERAPGEVAPPGTEAVDISHKPVPVYYTDTAVPPPPPPHYAAYYHQYMAQTAAIQATQPKPAPGPVKPNTGPVKSTGLSLMKNYNTDSNSDDSDTDDDSSTDSKEKPTIVKPPEDVQVVIDKMAAYVARNGDEFAEIVRAKKDPRFTFLEPNDIHHPYYLKLMKEKRGGHVTDVKKPAVSFSIKKQKEPDPILPKPALPYESSSEDDEDKEKQEEPQKNNSTNINNIPQNVPQAVVYKLETNSNINIINKPVETVPLTTSAQLKPKTVSVVPESIVHSVQDNDIKENSQEKTKVIDSEIKTQISRESTPRKDKSPTPDKKVDIPKEETSKNEKEKERRDKNKVKDKKKESKRDRKSPNRVKKRREEDRSHKKRAKYVKDDLENEIISIDDNVEELIDLTGDQYESKGFAELESDRQKQLERRRRAAEFLRKVGVDPAAAALPTNSLASAMVETLESIRKKKAEEEERLRKREKRRNRDRYGYNDDGDKSHRKSKRRRYKLSESEESDNDGSKKKKRKKDKKTSKTKKKRRQEQQDADNYEPIALDANLTSTLKELRTSSPTKDLVLPEEKNSSEDEKKKEREYSEGEWSSDSEEDSGESSVEG